MKLTKQKYRNAASAMVPAADDVHQSLAKNTQAVSFTRKPRGAWVEMWVWVPESFAILHATREEK